MKIRTLFFLACIILGITLSASFWNAQSAHSPVGRYPHLWPFVQGLSKRIYRHFYWSPRWRPQPLWDDQLDHDAIEDRLKNERIAYIMSLDTFFGKRMWSSHYLRMVILESGLIGLFKSGHKKNIARFKLRHYGGNFHHGEVAAYRLNRILGLRLVPPTVFRVIDGIPGSLQFYIHAPEQNVRKLYPNVDTESQSCDRIFCYVAGQWDYWMGNKLIAEYDGKLYLALIDNAGMYLHIQSRYGGPLYIEQGHPNYVAASDLSKEFPFEKAQTVPGSYEIIAPLFHPYLKEKHIKQVSKRPEHTFISWNQKLWVHYKDGQEAATYYAPLLETLADLSEDDLKTVWAELLAIDPQRAHLLIKSTFDRRDELLDYVISTHVIFFNKTLAF